jgi:O-antigen/teichoic acid export membrane protein
VAFGKDYVGTIAPLLWLLPGVAALSCSSITASVLAAQEKPKYSIWTGYISLGLNLVLNIMLIPRLGINGAAVSSSTSSIFAGMLWMFFFKKETAVPFKEMLIRAEDIRYLAKHLRLAVFRK